MIGTYTNLAIDEVSRERIANAQFITKASLIFSFVTYENHAIDLAWVCLAVSVQLSHNHVEFNQSVRTQVVM